MMPEARTDEAATLYAGHVMHMRLMPRRHRFRYRIWTLLLDLDRLEEVAGASRLFRLGRFGILSFHAGDHGPRDGTALRPWVDRCLAEAGRPPAARVRLLAMPRLLGYVFNPLSVYFCEDAAGGLQSVIYQIRNTFGDQQVHVLAAGTPETGMFRQVQDKAMFVSPFIPMEQTYRFSLGLPGARLSLRIRQSGPEGEVLIATETGQRIAFSDAALLRLILGHPLMTLKVIVAIHWQALRLALKGVRFLGHPGEGRVYREKGG